MRELKAEDLRAVCDPGTLPFASTLDLPPLDGMIKKALNVAVMDALAANVERLKQMRTEQPPLMANPRREGGGARVHAEP